MKVSEAIYRLRDPSFALSFVRNATLTLRAAVAGDAFSKIYRVIRPYTMLSLARLRGLYDGVRSVVIAGVPGAVVECGAAHGGSAALMGLTFEILVHRDTYGSSTVSAGCLSQPLVIRIGDLRTSTSAPVVPSRGKSKSSSLAWAWLHSPESPGPFSRDSCEE